MSADLNAISVGHSGRVAMLKAVFGSGDEQHDPVVSSRQMTPALFNAVFSGR